MHLEHDEIEILLVDDQEADRELVARALKRLDFSYRLQQLDSVKAVRDLPASQEPFGLVISDFELEDGDGLEVLNTVRARWPDTPVMFVTGSGSEDIAIAALRHGVADYVLKTSDLDELLPLRVRRVLEQAELTHSRERFAQVIETTPDFVGWCDSEGRIQYMNTGAEHLSGTLLADVLGTPISRFVPPERVGEYMEVAMAEAMATGSWAGEMELLCANGDRIPVSQVILAHRDRSGRLTHVSTVARDLRPVRAAEAALAETSTQLDYLTHHDVLTGLPNRHAMQQRLAGALQHIGETGGNAALLLLDLEGFKNINDSFGLAVGDQVLCTVAERLQRSLEDAGVLARLGGDDFALLVEGLRDPKDARAMADRVQGALEEPMEVQGQRLLVTANIGIAVAPGDGVAADELLRNADAALHQAKLEGGSTTVTFSAEMNVRAGEELKLRAGLRHAIDKGELFLAYQPVVHMVDSRIMGLEALVRWQHPELGTIPPDRFIRIAEETGLIIPLGEWVLRNALEQARRWQDECDFDGFVAVNLSMRQFRSPELASGIADALAAAGVPASRLHLELTESMLSSDPGYAREVLVRLKQQGMKIVIDDFGTGYSSLSYLKRFPLDVLKIDRSFVKDIPDDRDDVAIVEAVIGLAHALGLSVVAEGVETVAQRNLLIGERCDAAQGYMYSMPRPAEDIFRMLKTARVLPLEDRVSPRSS